MAFASISTSEAGRALGMGLLLVVASCTSDFVGTPLPSSCKVGELVCRENYLWTCDPRQRDTPWTWELCPHACVTPASGPAFCALSPTPTVECARPKSKACAGNSLLSCVDGYPREEATTCDSLCVETATCTAVCATREISPRCAPGVLAYCDGNSRVRCSCGHVVSRVDCEGFSTSCVELNATIGEESGAYAICKLLESPLCDGVAGVCIESRGVLWECFEGFVVRRLDCPSCSEDHCGPRDSKRVIDGVTPD